jgi:hypothetical protein
MRERERKRERKKERLEGLDSRFNLGEMIEENKI